MSIFTGSGVAIITPFNDDKTIDYNSFEKLVNFHIENKTDSIVVCGTTGEASTLTTKEHIDCVKFCVEKVNGKIPVIAGAGSNNTAHSIELCEKCEEVGIDGLLVITPYYNRTSQKGIVNHYKSIAKGRKVPIIAYNVPSRTALNIEPETVLEISKIKNIVGIKEASGNVSQIAKIRSLCSNDFYVYSGTDDLVVPVLSLGGKGVISVFSNVAPKVMHDMIQHYMDGDILKSQKMQLDAVDIMSKLFIDVSPIPVKKALSLMGYTKEVYREPLIKMEDENVAILTDAMKKYGLI